MNNYRTIQQKDMHKLFPAWEHNIPTLGTKHSQPGSKTALRLALSLLLIFVLGINTAWGQTGTDRSGIFYFVNGGSGKTTSPLNDPFITNITDPDDYFYLVPADYPQQDNKRDAWFSSDYSTVNGDPEKPYLTTYKTKKDAAEVPEDVTNRPHNSVWIVKFASTDSGTDYYYLIHAATGKYVVYDPPYSNNWNRKSVHLTDSPGENAKFAITLNNSNYNFRTKSKSSGNRFLNAANANENYYYSNDKTADGDADYFRGLVGLWSAVGGGSDWKPEATKLDAPTISVPDANNKVTITDANSLPSGYEIRYTTDGSTIPTATTGEVYSGPIPITASVTIKAVVVRYGMVLTEVVSETREPAPCATPVITFDNTNSMVSITCATDGSTIFYSTNGSNPTTNYSGPFSINGPTTIKAQATRENWTDSEVGTLVISQVVTPTIQNNGSNAISITTTTPDATIYYTTDGTDPTTSSTEYTDPLSDSFSGVTIKAIAVKENMITSAVGSGTVKLQCATPVITRDGMTFTLSCSMPTDATFYYSLDGTTPATLYNGAVSFTSNQLPMTVTAVARHSNYTDSETSSLELVNGSGTTDDPYMIYDTTDLTNFVTNVNNGTTTSAYYKLGSDISASGMAAITTDFTGVFDGNGYTISNLGHALFNRVNGGVVKNVILDNVGISSGSNVGAICNEATGATRIYNCGVLASNSTVEKDENGYDKITSCSSSIRGSNYVGSIVGLLDGSSRVINCFSYANVNGGSEAGGIVGHNNVATTATNLQTMVMNCMFYGEVSGSSIAPIYNGEIITNVGENTGVSNYNYFRLESSYIQNTAITKVYNCALGAETRFLQRFEFYRHLLNSHRELAAWWATGSMANKDEMMKWVLEPSQIGSSTPYPILKAPGYYPSVVNIDAENAPLVSERNKGGKLGTLSVTIESGSGAVFSAPTGASITKSSLTLNITDKDFDHFNFNYYKVQLPYYNEVGTGNYTGNRVVTGWKITSITGGTPGEYKEEDSDKGYNFADRNCTNKDLYSTSHRVFNQGAYWDVPEGVTAITIQPYWAKAAYVADAYPDVVYSQDMKNAYNVPNVGDGEKYTNNTSYDIAGEQQKVFTSINDAVTNANGLNKPTSNTVHDYAVVLVGNVHQYNVTNNAAIGGSYKYTVTTIDLDHDNEPDYSLMLRNDGRNKLHPVKWDFLNIVGLGMAQKSTGGTGSYNHGIFQPSNWFEVTNTALLRVTQFEYERSDRAVSPIILQGGVIEQWVSYQNNGTSNNTTFIHVGGNVWFKEFHMGVHQDKKDNSATKHPPVSVTGGDFNKFYLTGLYQSQADKYDDDAECFINGGRFGEVAGAGMEGIGISEGKGNITWIIDNADIDEFYGGGINHANPAHGNIHTIISNSHVNQFCGGPKFGDMESGCIVKTTATGCTFGTYFGAGYGGNSYNRYAPQNRNNVINLPGKGKLNNAEKDFNSWNEWVTLEYQQSYSSTYGGVSAKFDYQFIPMSSNIENVARLFVEFVGFSLATTRNVTSSLNNCTILGNFYGGGSLGKVEGDVTSSLTNCTVNGSVFGAGYSASLPSVEVMNIGFQTEPYYYTDLGSYRTAVFPTTTTYKWVHATEAEFSSKKVDNDNHILYTTADLTALGSVTGKATLNIEGTTSVTGSVYGGGEESNVAGNTEVNITGGTITENVFGGGKGSDDNFTCDKAMVGVNDDGACDDPASNENKDKGTKVSISNGIVNGNVYGGGEVGRVEWNTQVTIGAGEGTPIINGSVFGAGAGVETHGYSALVRGNSTVTVQGKAKVLQNVYGGGEKATVGRYWVKGIPTTPCDGETQPTIPEDLPDGMPYHQRRGGICKVVIQGEAQIGPDEGGTEIAGHVFGAGKGVVPNFIASGEGASQKMIKGDENTPDHLVVFDSENAYLEFLQTLALVTNTDVKIDGDAKVKGSVYGGSESGYVQHNTNVLVSGGTIGTEEQGGAFYGNVYGGGKGDAEHTGSTNNYLAAGIVKGYTKVKVEDGTILHNIYGGGAYGSVGIFDYDTTSGLPTGLNANAPENSGKTEIHITGGTIGTTGEENGMIFGSSRGDVGAPGSIHDKLAWVYDTHVAIGDTTENATITTATLLIRGSIYGGGENGHNFRNAYVRINGGTIGIPSDATYAYRGNVYGGGCGTDKYDSDSDGNGDTYNPLAGIVQGNATVTMTGGHVVHNVYGAGAMGSVGTDTSGGKTTVSVSGGRIGYDGSNNGNVYGAARGDLAATGNLAQVRETEVNISYTTTPAADNEGKTVQLIAGSVFGGGEAGTVKECVAVNMTGGLVLKDVYGGGALAHTQTSNWNATNNTWAEGKTSASNTTTVRLTGGTISGDAYGGGLGQKTGVNGATSNIPAYVYGDVLLDLNGTTTMDTNTGKPTTTGTASASTTRGCAVCQIFGCNNINGSPKGDVMVHVYATQNKLTETIAEKFIREKDCDTEKEENETDEAYVTRLKGILTGKITFAEALDITVSQANKDLAISQAATAADLKTAITNITTSIEAKTTAEINAARYDMVAVYGGGDMAAYNPVSPYAAQNTSGAKTQVIIEGCDVTSIETVYGGGNAAAVPETNVVINEAYEIQAVFGGGNGKDNLPNGDPNPGADIGTLDQGSNTYGTGNANSVLKGGYIHEAYGGSNTKGIVKGNLNQTSDPEGDCELILEKVVGAGKYADIDGDVNMTLSCQPSTKVPLLFAGADEANVNGNITLNITNGNFGKVFGGNNLGGAVKGKITVNVEETGCQPIKIDELYLGGNEAAYSIYGYYESDEVHPVTGKKILKPRTAEMHAITDPSAEGYKASVANPAADATHTFPYAQPELNIISCTSIGKVFGGGYGEGAMMYADPTVNINMVLGTPNGVTSSSIGEIGDVYGGGNAAKIIGNTTVNIGTDKTALGANITGSVYGGGNLADVTGNTYVNICAKIDGNDYVAVPVGTSGVTIGGNVFGGGKGKADTFTCEKAMIGEDGKGLNANYTDGNTSVIIGNGTVGTLDENGKLVEGTGNVYGGGQIGRVERNTTVTIGLGNGIATGTPESAPEIKGKVFGAGAGEEEHGYAALVRGNPTVTIQGNAKIGQSVYGGGEIASVARYKVAETQEEATAHGVDVDMPYVLENNDYGHCVVTIKGYAEIGPNDMKMYHENVAVGNDKPDDYGHVFGAGKGVLPKVYVSYGKSSNGPKRMILYNTNVHTNSNPNWAWVDPDDTENNKNIWEYFASEEKYFEFIHTLALATETEVTIDGAAFVKGSVYGGSENGLVQFDTKVYIKDGQIGNGDGVNRRYSESDWSSESLAECAHWDYGKDTNQDGKKDLFAPYDPNANAEGDLDKYPKVDAQSEAKSTEGGRRIATDGHTYYGNVFGGGSGSVPYFDTQQGISRYISTAGEVRGDTYVTISGGHILTNVYGGNEATNVLGTAHVTMTGGTVGVPRTAQQIKDHPVTCYVFGAGKGDQRIFFNKETNVNDAIVKVEGGTIYGSVFGGGEDGHVLRNTSVTIGKTDGTGPKIGTVGSTYVDGNVFGGGRGFGGEALTAGNVGGAVDLIINGGEMLGSIYGGGRLASVGYGLYLTTEDGYGVMRPDNVDDKGNSVANFKRGYITVTVNGGTIGKEFADDTEGEHSGNVFGGSMGRLTKLDGSPFDAANHWSLLATAKSTKVYINGGTIKRSVYGGGEMGTVTNDAIVNVSGGTIGTLGKGGAEFGNVYGGGKGYVDPAGGNYMAAGIIKGNTTVAVSGTPQILHNVYGGGAYGSVGTFTDFDAQGFPTALTAETGTASVTVTGGTIGSTGKDNGMVFGSSRGLEGNPETDANVDKIAWVGNTIVTIGTQNSETGPSIKGSVYGGGENGHNFQNASVTVHSGTIGIPSGEKVTIGDIEYEGARFPNRGNVYGSGCGTDTYTGTDSKTYFDFNAGIVRGNTTVLIDGGHVVHNVYGGGAMGSVGTYTFNDNGKPISCAEGTGTCTVTVSGGQIGVAGATMAGHGKGGPDDFGHVFGAGRGEMHDPDEYPNVETCAYFNKTVLTISGSAFLIGSAYGGSESGHVLGDTEVNISGGQIGCGKNAIARYEDNVWENNNPTEDLECASWPFASPFAPYDPFANATGNLDQYSNERSTEGGRLEASDGHTYFGNVFGGGSGSVPYFDTTQGISKYLSTAGTVEGNTTVTISGGHILTNVYGGCEATNVKGSATIKMTGGTVGVPRTDAQIIAHPLTGYVFGAGKGDQRIFFNKETNVNHSIVTVEGGRIYGSVYGGGEDGHVLGNVTMTIGKTGSTGPTIGTRGTSYYDGHVFGGGRGFGGEALTAGNVGGAVTLDIQSGQILGSVYGGGRLASVGYGLYLTTEEGYGVMREDNQYDGSYPNPSTEVASTFYNKGRGKIYLTVSGGTIGNNVVNDKYGGNVYGGSMGRSTKLDGSSFDDPNHWTLLATVKQTTLNVTGGTIRRNVYGGGELGVVKGDVAVTIDGGTIEKDVYGGGALANTNTWAEENSSSYTTTVNLLDGLVKGDAYGGGLGQKIGFDGGTSDVEATVYGDITVNLGDADATKATKFNINYENTGEKDEANNPISVVQSGRVFGCNNLNGSPRGDVTVNVYKTVAGNVARTTADPEDSGRANRTTSVEHKYELAAIYGGGNLANYSATGKKANVIIHTCDVSVQYVYGGGNAAAVPGTDVLVKGAWEIDHVFGGGNGKDMYKKGNEWKLNAGANVTGNTNTLLIGGYIHEAYGGSNEKGTIGGNVTINTNSEHEDCACALELSKLYGAGKNADIEGDLIVVLDCAPETKTAEIYGGAENANVKGNVELTITSGSFGKVFGGNNQSGAIFGHIILNVEETSCRPIVIDELYGCGNNAAYSVYGYKDGGTDADGYPIYIPRTSKTDGTAVTFDGKPHTNPGDQGYADPEVNIISCTRIGQVFGGGLGSGATVYGNPTVNIDQIPGAFAAQIDRDGDDVADNNSNALGEIGDVFGGGNAANVVGNTNVNIGTKDKVKLHVRVKDDGTYEMSEDKTVLGANITGNVYGGGNEAEVTGDTNVNIGKKSE